GMRSSLAEKRGYALAGATLVAERRRCVLRRVRLADDELRRAAKDEAPAPAAEAQRDPDRRRIGVETLCEQGALAKELHELAWLEQARADGSGREGGIRVLVTFVYPCTAGVLPVLRAARAERSTPQ